MLLNSSMLSSLRFFAAAARTSSFKQAATELHVTPGAVSQQIRHLEEVLRCKLFYRLVRQVTLTKEGQRFAAVVQQALTDIENGAREIAASAASVDIKLRVGPSFSLRWLVPRLADFYAHHSRIRLFVQAAHGALDPERREFDLAVELLRNRIPGMQCEVLMEEYLIPVCTPEYLKKHPLKHPKDLADCTLLHDAQPWVGSPEDAEWRHWLNAVGAAGVSSSRGQFFSLANISLEAAINHQGVAMGRAALLEDWLSTGQLVMPFKRIVKSPTRYFLLYQRKAVARPELQTVIQWLRERATAFRPIESRTR